MVGPLWRDPETQTWEPNTVTNSEVVQVVRCCWGVLLEAVSGKRVIGRWRTFVYKYPFEYVFSFIFFKMGFLGNIMLGTELCPGWKEVGL